MSPNPKTSRAGLQRGVFVSLALAMMLGGAEAKIVQQTAEDPPAIQPDASVHVDYFLFGAVSSWWNQNPNLPFRWHDWGSLGTISITRAVLHDALALRLARDAEHHAIRFNRPRSWLLKGTRFRGTATPLRTFQNHSGLTCRDFSHVVSLEDGDQTLTGTACRQLDGAWLLMAGRNVGETVSHPTAGASQPD